MSTFQLQFQIGSNVHTVKTNKLSPKTTLNRYLRDILSLKGTKRMCLEGGCGACVVAIERPDIDTQQTQILAVNSCLMPILACHNLRIHTIEDITVHPIQKKLAEYNGSQCGYCSSGMVMNMYALYENRSKLEKYDVENAFGGNLCRCTGYRPILDAFKSFCDTNALPDIEDLKLCNKITRNMNDFELVHMKWIRVTTLKALLVVLEKYGNAIYRLVGGNTAQGVFPDYKTTNYDIYIDINNVKELQGYQLVNNKLILGANLSLTKTMKIFEEIADKYSKFSHLKQLKKHLDLIANIPVRNVGSLAGNLMIKHDHNEFPSDIFVILTTVGARLLIADSLGVKYEIMMEYFLNFAMKKKVITNIILPAINSHVKLQTYKIMPKSQNALALVNAGFLFELNHENIVQSAKIIYGNIQSQFSHASKTEEFLKNKFLYDNNILQKTYKILDTELNTTDYKKNLAISLFYKTILKWAPKNLVQPRHLSGSTLLQRPISSGQQQYPTVEALYPVTQPLNKLESLRQTEGKAEYVDDIPILPNQQYGALVLADAPPHSIITQIDPTDALKLKTITAFYDYKSIKGNNNFMPSSLGFQEIEEIFCSGTIKYYHQPIGILIGTNPETIEESTHLIKISYKKSDEPIYTNVRQILDSNATDRITEAISVLPKKQGNNIFMLIKGKFDIHPQYHLHMETQCCYVQPNEDGVHVYPSSQWMDQIQTAVAGALKINANRVDVSIRRCGGAFGAKITRNGLVACATAIAADHLQKPVKMVLSLGTNMRIIGKRWPLTGNYELAVNAQGIIQYLNADLYTDTGVTRNESGIDDTIKMFMANYASDTYALNANFVRTDLPANTWARAPGTTEGMAMIESIMEHIALLLGLDPLNVRQANMIDPKLLGHVNTLKKSSDYEQRREIIIEFNRNNRWRKKGICLVPMAYHFSIFGPWSCTVSIYHSDGTVAICHGGIEIGQGINTKVVQACAYKLGIPIDIIRVLPSNNFVSPNDLNTGGSITSEAVCYSVLLACEVLLERMKPYRKSKQSWSELVRDCFKNYVELTARGIYSPKSESIKPYIIYGACVTEVEIDILTGQYQLNRVDILEDTGYSINPDIDIGQVEGAFVMGMGYYTTEALKYSADGKLLNSTILSYEPPGPKDIPIDFRVKFPDKNPNTVGVLKSKATAEPPLCMTICVPLAIRNAVASARQDSDKEKPIWYSIDGPSTVEHTFMNSLNDYSQYLL